MEGKVIFYADLITDAIKYTINETNRRRVKQLQYNEEHGITPQTIMKTVEQIMQSTAIAEGYDRTKESSDQKVDFSEYLELDSLNSVIELMQKEMKKAASNLEFERAAELRDRIWELKNPSQSTVE